MACISSAERCLVIVHHFAVPMREPGHDDRHPADDQRGLDGAGAGVADDHPRSRQQGLEAPPRSLSGWPAACCFGAGAVPCWMKHGISGWLPAQWSTQLTSRENGWWSVPRVTTTPVVVAARHSIDARTRTVPG